MTLSQSISDKLATLDRNPRRSMWGMVLFAVIYYLIVSLQGFDFADEGFSLTFYQNIYTHPADVEYLFLYYLTGLIGGAWEWLFGSLGNYGFRILFALVSGCIVLTTFEILKPHFKTSTIVLATLACTLYPGLCLYYFNHDCLTALLFLLTILALNRGVDGSNKAWWIMGILLVLNTSVRLPNILLMMLIIAPLVEALYSGNYRKAGSNTLRIIGGCTLGGILLLITLYALGHLHTYLSALQSLFVMSSDTSDTHGAANMLSRYFSTYKLIINATLYGLIVSILYVIITRYVKIKGIHIIAGVICGAILYSFLTRSFYAMWGGVTATSIIYALQHHSNQRHMILALSALVMLIVIPIGGDSYANICYSCMWLGMPLLIELIRRPMPWKLTYSDEYRQDVEISTNHKELQQIGLIAGIVFLAYVALHTNCYFDEGDRREKIHRPDTDCVTTFTSQERALIIDEIAVNTRKHATEGNYLLVFDNLPMLHYLTGMQPYLGSPWSTFWGNRMFELQLLKAENSSRPLPLIAVPHFFYKDLSETFYLNPDQHPEMEQKIALLADFMFRHGYQVVYTDRYITLYAVSE